MTVPFYVIEFTVHFLSFYLLVTENQKKRKKKRIFLSILYFSSPRPCHCEIFVSLIFPWLLLKRVNLFYRLPNGGCLLYGILLFLSVLLSHRFLVISQCSEHFCKHFLLFFYLLTFCNGCSVLLWKQYVVQRRNVQWN